MKAVIAWLVTGLAALVLPATAEAKTLCSVTATGVAFGAYNPIGGAGVDITGTVTLSCDKDKTDYLITLSTGGSGDYSARSMTHAGDQLPYQLYLDSARTVIWGDGTGGTGVVSGVLPKKETSISFTVYGRVYGGVNVAPGFFTDAIVVTALYDQ